MYGRITRAVAAGSSYDFPVGQNPSTATAPNYPYELMNIHFNTITGFSYLTVSFDNPANAPTSGNPGLPLTEQLYNYTFIVDNGGTNTGVGGPNGGVWTVFTASAPADIYTNAPTTATYDMTLYGTNFSNGGTDNTGTYYSFVKRSPYPTCAGFSWILDGVYSSSSNPGTLITAVRGGLSGFSQFSLAHHVTPLPIDLVAFDATCVSPNILLSWITASETNNKNFILERSCDENFFNYQTIDTIPGAGNSSTIKQYSYLDKDSPGNCYYRLSQADYNGATKQFAPISINCKENSDFNFIGALPNPTDRELNIIYSDEKNENIQLTITDMLGQPIMARDIASQPGLNKITIDLTDYSTGLYMVRLNNNNKSFAKKVVKTK